MGTAGLVKQSAGVSFTGVNLDFLWRRGLTSYISRLRVLAFLESYFSRIESPGLPQHPPKPPTVHIRIIED